MVDSLLLFGLHKKLRFRKPVITDWGYTAEKGQIDRTVFQTLIFRFQGPNLLYYIVLYYKWTSLNL